MSFPFRPTLCFQGGTHSAQTLAEAARRRGFTLASEPEADIVFLAMDTPTDKDGNRETQSIRALVKEILKRPLRNCLVLTSQVEPGFCRSFDDERLYHMAETLRMEDAIQRAMFPEMIILGRQAPWGNNCCDALQRYTEAFDCPIIFCSYEDAEFSKMAINAHLAMQVDTATWLAGIADKVNADWKMIQRILRHDRRIGKYSYLTPGDWRKSSHILRDMVTLESYDTRPPIP